MEWLVEFELPSPAQDDGWIIQQVSRSYDIRRADGTVDNPELNRPKPPYYEAWRVEKGRTRTATRYNVDADSGADSRTYDDTFDQPNRGLLKGTFKVDALAKFYALPLPPTFVQNNPATKALTLPSTVQRPAFWDDTGTRRTLIVTWDCTFGRKDLSSKIQKSVQEKKK